MMRAPTTDANPGFCPFISTTFCSLTDCPNSTCTAPSVDFVQALCYMQCAGLPFPEIDPNICGFIPGGFSQQIMDAVCGDNYGKLLSFDNGDCAAPVDCSLSSFSAFSGCSIPSCLATEPFGGTRTRIRTIVAPGNSGGLSCVDQVFSDIEPCFNRLPVTYSSFDTETNAFIQSVSQPQCSSDGCSLSSWFSISGFLGGCGSCSQDWARSLSYIGNIDQCPTDPALFFSNSTCCGKDPGIKFAKCAQLPACTQCQWSDIRNSPFRCTGISGTRTLYRDMQLVSNSNDPRQNCQTTAAFNCYYDTSSNAPSGNQFYGNSTLSCSKYFFSCTTGGIGECPIGCNGQACNGHGAPVYTTIPDTSITSCTCACYTGFSGPNCEIQLPRCPIASLSELECNGFGSCNSISYACECENPFDTTPDCTGSSTSWCWVYGNVTGRFDVGTTTIQNMTKLLGVIPIASTSTYTFYEDDCMNLETIVLDDGFKSSFTYLPIKPLFLSSEIGVPPNTINRIGLSGKIESRVPFTLVNKIRYCEDIYESTFDILTNSIGYPKAQYFIPRYVPFSSPVQCESLFTIRTISGQFVDYYNESQLQLSSSVLGPILQRYYV